MSEIVFLAGTDPTSTTDTFYTNAKQFFTDRDPTIPVVGPKPGQKALSLESVFAELTTRASDSPDGVFDVISIVSRPTGMGGMDMPLHQTDEASGGVTLRGQLGNAVLNARAKAAGALLPPESGAISAQTRIVLYGCDAGRDTQFLTSLGELFGAPASVAAPIRVGVFRLKDGAIQHRLARTWSVLWGAGSIVSTATTGWAAAHATFTQKTDVKFITDPTVSSTISSLAAGATLDSTKTEFFFAEVFSVQKSAISDVLPVSSAVIKSGDDDDTTVPVTIGVPDMTPGNADLSDPNWATMNITAFASVIDEDVSLADSRQYQTLSFATQKAQATGPAPVPTADGAPPPPPTDPGSPTESDGLRVLAEQYVAAGGLQSDFDAFAADALLPAVEPWVADADAADLPDPDDGFVLYGPEDGEDSIT
jgi:hypothetical protein